MTMKSIDYIKKSIIVLTEYTRTESKERQKISSFTSNKRGGILDFIYTMSSILSKKGIGNVIHLAYVNDNKYHIFITVPDPDNAKLYWVETFIDEFIGVHEVYSVSDIISKINTDNAPLDYKKYIIDDLKRCKTIQSIFDSVIYHPVIESVDSVISKKKDIIQKIEKAVKDAGFKMDIDKKSMDVFTTSEYKRNFVSDTNGVCIADIGKEHYNEVYTIINDLLKGNKDFTITKDNYWTLFLNIPQSSDMYMKEQVEYLDALDYESYFTEAVDDTYFIREEIYPMVETVLSTPQGTKMFKRLVEEFVNRNSQKLLTIGPVHMVPFTDDDKEAFYKLFGTNEKDLKKSIAKMTSHVNNKANWKLISQNPIFCVFYCCIRHFTIKKDIKNKDTALIIYALASYPSLFHNYFQYGANPGVMHYTIDNMTNKFTIKTAGHVFGTLRQSISNSWEFHKNHFEDMPDKEVIRFIQRIRNDQNSLLKKIANEYYDNHKKGLTVSTTVDSFDDNAVVDDIDNNTSIVENVSRKIVNGMMTGGVNIQLAEIAAKICQISVVDSRFYITKIMVDKEMGKLQRFIESILFIFLYDENHKPNDINTSEFVVKFAQELFRKTNSSNPNIKFIKATLDEWGEASGIHQQFKREPSRVNYKKAIYFYVIFSIQRYNM